MNRILSSLGCFGLVLLAIVYVLGVTESIKYVSRLERTVVLTGAVLAAAAVAFVRDRIKNRPLRARHKFGVRSQTPQESINPPAQVDLDTWLPPPQTSQPAGPIHEAILNSRRQAILFRQIVPPNHDPAHLSFFGGLPIAPSGFQWPRGELRPYSFIMQLDCSAVPDDGRLGMFPDHGVLYLFLDLAWGQEDLFRVIWEPGPTRGWTEINPPADLPYAYDHKETWHWPQSDADWPRLLPKWPFDPVLIQGGPLPDDPDDEETEQTYAWPGTIDPNQAIPAIEGAVVQSRSFAFGKTRRDRPFAGFPHDWNAVRISTGLIAKGIKRELSFPELRKRHFRELSDEEFAAKIADLQAALRRWSDRASAAAPFDEVPPAERDQFWSWVKEHNWITSFPMIYVGDLSVEASLSASPEAAARIPPDAVDYIRSRHALASELEGKLYINIPDRMLAPPVDVQGDIDERVREFILFLELSSNEGLAHYFAEGVLQFWIRPDDLAARRFDRVELSTTAY